MAVVLPSSSVRLEDLVEDRLTAWLPDAAGDVDLEAYCQGAEPGTGTVLLPLRVPKPDGGDMLIHQCHPGWVVRLRRAIAPVVDQVDELLGAGVFGYRRGADADTRYAHQYAAFRDYAETRSADAGHVVFADIKGFFRAVNSRSAQTTMEHVLGRSMPGLGDVARAWQAAGVTYLPPGYCDVRLIANVVLHEVDRSLPVPFGRWVDDYRLFVSPGKDPNDVLQVLADALGRAGLELNRAKTRIVPGPQAVAEHKNTLHSVYHPERDPKELLRTNLRQLFQTVQNDPRAHRRELRFVMSRLAARKMMLRSRSRRTH